MGVPRGARVRSWHETDMPTCLAKVRCEIISGIGQRSAGAYCRASLQSGQQRLTGWTVVRRGFGRALRRARRTNC